MSELIGNACLGCQGRQHNVTLLLQTLATSAEHFPARTGVSDPANTIVSRGAFLETEHVHQFLSDQHHNMKAGISSCVSEEQAA